MTNNIERELCQRCVRKSSKRLDRIRSFWGKFSVMRKYNDDVGMVYIPILPCIRIFQPTFRGGKKRASNAEFGLQEFLPRCGIQPILHS